MNTRAFTSVVRVQQTDPGNELEGRPRSWETIAEMKGDVRPWNGSTAGISTGASGMEYWSAAQVLSEVTHRVWTRLEGFQADASMRLEIDTPSGRTILLEVLSVVELHGRARFLEWRCKETA